MKSKVYLLPCESYDSELIYQGFKNLLIDLNLHKLIPQNSKILLKPNLLNGSAPEKAVTTHPAVFEAVIKYLIDLGYNNLTYGDGSGVGSPAQSNVLQITGINKPAAELKLKPSPFNEAVTVQFPEGITAKKFVLFKDATDADAIISISKMKTHALENITGALKNQYGLVYSKQKAIGHAKYPNSKKFAEMIADLNAYLKPKLFIMDGIVAMEGNGPGSGDLKPMNVVLISTDPVALDTTFSKLVYLNPKYVPTSVAASRIGLGTMKEDEIEVITPDGSITLDEAQKRFGDADFVVNRAQSHFWNLKATFATLLNQHSDKPVVDLSKCIACGICQDACPVEGKAVHSGNGQKATYDYKKCIRCYCCQEMCPAHAISKK